MFLVQQKYCQFVNNKKRGLFPSEVSHKKREEATNTISSYFIQQPAPRSPMRKSDGAGKKTTYCSTLTK